MSVTGWTWLFAFLLLGMCIGGIWFAVVAHETPKSLADMDDRIDELERRMDKIQGGIPTKDTFTPVLPADTPAFTKRARKAVRLEDADTDPEMPLAGPPTTGVPVVTTLKAPNALDRPRTERSSDPTVLGSADKPTAAQSGGPGTTPDFTVKPPVDAKNYGRHAAKS